MAKKENTVTVDKKCLVQFSIGNKYKDEVWCEVVPMDACHLLLGRPWKFDRKTIHDGFKNTYRFKKEGINFLLTPLVPQQEPRKENSLFIPHAKLQRNLKSGGNFFALIILESNKQTSSPLPPVIQSLVSEFNDVFPTEIPPGLPLMRDVHHCINFIPGVVIPNRPAYRMNPKD